MAEADNGRIARGLAPGTRMGRYTLLHRLAVGGMAELYVARQGGIEGFERVWDLIDRGCPAVLERALELEAERA